MKSLVVTAALASLSGTAFAECNPNTGSGYIFVHQHCMAQNGCGSVNNLEAGETVLIVSNVIWDNVGNGRYPRSQFRDEAQIQAGFRVNGDVSACYSDYDEAVDDMRSLQARLSRSGWEIISIYLDDT